MARCMWLGAVTVTTWSSRRKNGGDNGVMPLQGSCGPDWRHTGDTTTWNRLLPALRSLDQSESAFKRALTTHLFSTAQHHWDIFMIYGVCKDCVCVCVSVRSVCCCWVVDQWSRVETCLSESLWPSTSCVSMTSKIWWWACLNRITSSQMQTSPAYWPRLEVERDVWSLYYVCDTDLELT